MVAVGGIKTCGDKMTERKVYYGWACLLVSIMLDLVVIWKLTGNAYLFEILGVAIFLLGVALIIEV